MGPGVTFNCYLRQTGLMQGAVRAIKSTPGLVMMYVDQGQMTWHEKGSTRHAHGTLSPSLTEKNRQNLILIMVN